MAIRDLLQLTRRQLLKIGGAFLFGAAAGDALSADDQMTSSSSCTFVGDPSQLFQSPCGGQEATELMPTSPFILHPFEQDLPVPVPLKTEALSPPYGYGLGQQSNNGELNSTHSIKPADIGYPEPDTYHIKLQVGFHCVTNSTVQPIDANGNPVTPPQAAKFVDGRLPPSSIYGFNGTFPGPMIYGRYGKPALVRFENELDPTRVHGLFGAPKGQFLTHLHNGHTAPESDGNPHATPHGYHPGQWVDNLYLNYPAGGDENEKQSFLWFHDHFEGYTGANVYRGLVGLYPIYDPDKDPGDENYGLRLPGVPNKDTGRVDYDIPLAIFDCALDDGVTPHQDFHVGCGETHPEWWGMTFFKHFPNHGFVGDIFTVNGKAFPVLHVKRRQYRFRFLDASISRVYELGLMKSASGKLQEARGTQGQLLLPDGQQCMQFVQIASEGGLLPDSTLRNSFEIWPSRRKELIVDFTHYMKGPDGTRKETKAGDVIYLVNVAKMEDGRKPDSSDPSYKVPILKLVIDDLPATETDNSAAVFDAAGNFASRKLRPLPDIDFSDAALSKLTHRSFELQRGGGSGGLNLDPVTAVLNRETQWLINDRPFQVCEPLARTQKGYAEVWRVKNGGGGWVHPMHFHQEEHRIIEKNGVRYNAVTPVGPDDVFAKEDTIALGPGEEVVIYRNFRTFPTATQAAVGTTAKYVAHCHNLAHEDHTMMFGWEIIGNSRSTTT